jgi:predicted Zn-dependent peptidase
MDKLLSDGITPRELIETKEQLKSNTIIGMENMGARMSHYGKGSLLKNDITSMDDLIEGVNNVTLDDVNRLIHETFQYNQESITLATPFDEDLEKL